MISPFHLLMMYLGGYWITLQRYWAVCKSEILTDGSADCALDGKMYSRAVRVHKLFFEALHRIFLETFLEEHQKSIKHLVGDINIWQKTSVLKTLMILKIQIALETL